MGANTAIEWTDHSWSPWWGCTQVSVGDKGACVNCYAEALDKRTGGAHWGPHAPRRSLSGAHWREPFKWDRAAARDGVRRFVFPSMCDPFDNQVDPEWRRWFFALMRATPNLVWLLLTKRPSMIVKLSEEAGGLPPNAALGATIVTQVEAERDLPHLLSAKYQLSALFAFASCEPLMDELTLTHLHPPVEWQRDRIGSWNALAGGNTLNLSGYVPRDDKGRSVTLDWVIAGGESGGGARPSNPDWFRSLRDQCATAGVPFFMKQMTKKGPIPEDLLVREVPRAA